jgi:dolichol kinase
MHQSTTTGHELQGMTGQISMSNEVKRKLIHLCSISIPFLFWHLDQGPVLAILVPATLLAVAIEVLRRAVPTFEHQFRRFFGPLLRPHESSDKPEINGATYVLVSATLCILIFPKVVAVTAFAVLIVSDTASALIGRRYGSTPFFRKSVVGSAAFFVTAMIVVCIVAYAANVSWPFIAAGTAASIVATLVEAISHGGGSIDDNLTIPFAFGAVLWLGIYLADLQIQDWLM